MLVLLPWLGDKVKIPRKDAIKIALLGVMIVVFNQAFYIWGQGYTSAGHGSLLFAFTPIFIYVLSMIVLKERFTARRVLGTALAVVGAALVVSQSGMEFNREMLKGDFIILIAVLVWAVYTIYGKALVEKYGAFKVTCYAAVSGTIAYFPFGVQQTLQTDLGAISMNGWLSVLYMGTGLSIGAYVLWYWAIKHFDASRVGPFHNIQPVIATYFAYLMINEIITGQFIVGGILVLCGVLVVELTGKRTQEELAGPPRK
jgi:drug/metabolite transporter (DMT)-like permease